MALVSLTHGRVTFDPGQDQYLEIKLNAKSTENTLIQGVGVPERLYYRLDAEVGPGRTVFRLPLADVLVPEHIGPNDLGVYGLKRLSNGDNAFLPVHAHPAGTKDEAEIVAVVRPGADVSDVMWRRYGPNTSRTDWAEVAGGKGLVPKGSRLEIELGSDIPPQTILEVSFLLRGAGRSDQFVLMPH